MSPRIGPGSVDLDHRVRRETDEKNNVYNHLPFLQLEISGITPSGRDYFMAVVGKISKKRSKIY